MYFAGYFLGDKIQRFKLSSRSEGSILMTWYPSNDEWIIHIDSNDTFFMHCLRFYKAP